MGKDKGCNFSNFWNLFRVSGQQVCYSPGRSKIWQHFFKIRLFFSYHFNSNVFWARSTVEAELIPGKQGARQLYTLGDSEFPLGGSRKPENLTGHRVQNSARIPVTQAQEQTLDPRAVRHQHYYIAIPTGCPKPGP